MAHRLIRVDVDFRRRWRWQRRFAVRRQAFLVNPSSLWGQLARVYEVFADRIDPALRAAHSAIANRGHGDLPAIRQDLDRGVEDLGSEHGQWDVPVLRYGLEACVHVARSNEVDGTRITNRDGSQSQTSFSGLQQSRNRQRRKWAQS